jgi:hypothetical protein
VDIDEVNEGRHGLVLPLRLKVSSTLEQAQRRCIGVLLGGVVLQPTHGLRQRWSRAVPSRLIRRVDYDPQTQTLSVWLVANENRYEYQEVPAHIHAAFRRAFSKGRFFNAHIRNRFEYRIVGENTPVD